MKSVRGVAFLVVLCVTTFGAPGAARGSGDAAWNLQRTPNLPETLVWPEPGLSEQAKQANSTLSNSRALKLPSLPG